MKPIKLNIMKLSKMKKLSTVTKENPGSATLALLIGLIPGLIDQFLPIAELIGIGQNVITLIGLIGGAIVYVLTYVNNFKS